MFNQITTKEWDKVSYQTLGLNQEHAKKFQKFLEEKQLTHALDFGLEGITTCAHVGIIRFADFQLNILPKIIGEEDSLCLENLMFMLRYTRKLEIHSMDSAEISQTKQPFLEVLIAHYANILLNALQRHIPHQYETREDNLPTVKGRILFAKNHLVNATNLARTYCQFDEFTPDNLLNQTLKFVSHALQKLTSVSQTRQKLLKINAIYDEVALRPVSYTETQKIILNRNQAMFKEPLELTQMFLQHSTISLHNQTFTNLAILFDMNKLFEEFVATALEKAFPGQVQTQKSRTIIDSIGGYANTSYSIRPDILFQNDTIIDTKYKILDLPNNKPSEADIYQMLTYNRFFNCRNIILCYPTYQKNYHLLSVLEDNDCSITLLTLDLHQKLTESYLQRIFYESFN
ncbi:McrC family protein [Candidatus Avelusimicrobium fimicolum]|uniref:McrC family protein n=1 Tax=Candidatus Avelusimicrobium fimicolum TaxID=3416216 RepID=UPI003D0AC088